MKNLFYSLWTVSILVGQTLDINALRMAQSNIGSSPLDNGAMISERQLQTKIKIDKPIDPDIYLVGPGDQFLVNIISSNNVSNYTLTVSPTGEILIPTIGVVQLNNSSLTSSINIMKSAIKSMNQSTKVFIILSEIREFKIKVIGHLQNPGFYTVTPVTRVSDLFKDLLTEINSDQKSLNENNNDKNDAHSKSKNDSELIYPELSTRNAIIIRNQDSLKIDLAKFGATGIDHYNPFLNQGDILIFPLKQHLVGIYGGINIPGQYEFVADETLKELIHLAGGLRPDADPNKIDITRFTSSTKKYSFETSIEEAQNIKMQPEDHIMIRYNQNYKKQDIVYILGEVLFPGVYSVEPGITTVNDVLLKAGGFTSRADQTKMMINNSYIGSIPDKEKERIFIIPEENRSIEEKAYVKARMVTQKGTLESNSKEQTNTILKFKLSKNDEIIIPENYNYIEILGAVEKPGRYPYQNSSSISDYLELAGGLTHTATSKKYIIKAGTGQRLPIKKDSIIENGDAIFIAEKLEFNKWIVLKDILSALGQVAALIVVIQSSTGN